MRPLQIRLFSGSDDRSGGREIFAWIDKQFAKQGFLPSSPFLGALAYIRERRVGLSVYLDDPEVSVNTNRERALRVIPMGKKQLAVQLD